MNFLNIAFPASSALPVAEIAISAIVAAARPLLGLGVLATMLVAFKPLLLGMVRAALLLVHPSKTREQKSALRNLSNLRAIHQVANNLDSSSPAMAAELRALASRG